MTKIILFFFIGITSVLFSSQISRYFSNSSPPPAKIAAITENAENLATPPPATPSAATEEKPAEEKPAEEMDIYPFNSSLLQIPKTELALFEFKSEEPGWYSVNDNVMGGISTSTVDVDEEEQQLTFSGMLSLENNGGFVSTRSQAETVDLSAFDGIKLRVRGDGNSYRLRIRTETTGPEIAYTAIFSTEANTWQEVYIYFPEMIPLYRGYFVREAGPIDLKSIRSFGLMLADKQQGEFLLEVDWIKAFALVQLAEKQSNNIPS